MKNICVITGGGSGMGLATAKALGQENYIIIAGRNRKKLDAALTALKAKGVDAESLCCDISDQKSVNQLASRAKQAGHIKSVINAAGLSPHMGDAKTIFQVNAIGTINMHEAFFDCMEEGGSIIDVSSMSGHLVPNIIIPKKSYKYSRIDKNAFNKKIMSRLCMLPKKLRSEVAYAISKNFVIWYAKADAVKFGEKGIRVLSISPGFFETSMGDLEKNRTEAYIKNSAINRMGHVEEIANLITFCVSNKASYLTGTDILCDGGCIASRSQPVRKK